MEDESRMIMDSEFFREELEKFNRKYTDLLKYGNVHEEDYKDSALKLQGVTEFVNNLGRPMLEAIKREEDLEKQRNAGDHPEAPRKTQRKRLS